MRLRPSVGVAVVAASVVAVGTVLVLWQDDGSDESRDVVITHGSDSRPSATASDWVTYADHVVVASAIDETEVRPTHEELDRGEGTIMREVTLQADEVLWSREDAPQPAPTTWSRMSAGWFFKGDPANRSTMVLDEHSRVEPGHSYIVAIFWACDENGVGDWQELGEGSTVPYDNGKIGEGEHEGTPRTAEEAAQAATEANGGLEEQLVGHSAATLKDELVAATPGDRSSAYPGGECPTGQ